jgi:hypothetical protein
MTPSGIEPATFRFVVQYFNHCATISGPKDFIKYRWLMSVMLTYETDSDDELFKEPDRQCTYNLRFRCVRVTIGAVEKRQVLRILSACL